jgi:methylthioribulose-1-phosphate dehydratase
MPETSNDFRTIAKELAELGKSFYGRGWVFGTSGNFSAVLSQDPLRLAITASGAHKGELRTQDFLMIDKSGAVLEGSGKPSAETLLHLSIARPLASGAILHTHSVWATILSETYAAAGGIAVEGYEMVKGLAGVPTHQHREWIPILNNTQDYAALADEISGLLEKNSSLHGFLLRRHGLYTWGDSIFEARRHVEILEFLLEVLGRQRLAAGG